LHGTSRNNQTFRVFEDPKGFCAIHFGTRSDFISFFRVEANVAVMKVHTIAVSLKRPQK
jgi:hypothetical protein